MSAETSNPIKKRKPLKEINKDNDYLGDKEEDDLEEDTAFAAPIDDSEVSDILADRFKKLSIPRAMTRRASSAPADATERYTEYSAQSTFPFTAYHYVRGNRKMVTVDILMPNLHKKNFCVKVHPSGMYLEV